MNIYAGNLSYKLSEEDLKSTFLQYGEVSQVTLISDQRSGQSKGFGFIEMTHQAEAEGAIEALDGTSIKGRIMKVKQAKTR